MTQPMLNSPCIVTGVRQCVAAAVPQHVCMHREVGAGTLADSLDKPIDGVRGERSATLGREHESRVGELPTKLTQCPHLIAPQRVNGRLARLDAPDVKASRSAEFDLTPFQVANFSSPQTMAERDQDQGGITVTVSTLPRLLRELFDFRERQIFPLP